MSWFLDDMYDEKSALIQKTKMFRNAPSKKSSRAFLNKTQKSRFQKKMIVIEYFQQGTSVSFF